MCRFYFLLFFTCVYFPGICQLPEVDDILKPPDVDPAYVELNQSLWTVRLFTSYKYQSFGLKNNSGQVFYRPRRPFSGGIGFSYQTLLVDIGFRLAGGNEDGTSRRFDLQTSALVKDFIVGLNIQSYQGFEERNPEEFDNYREDIRTTTVRLQGLAFPNHRQISFRTIQTGIDRQLQGAGSWLYGGFIGFHKMKADSSIIPSYELNNFRDDFMIERLVMGNLGISGGYTYIQPLTSQLYVAGTLIPGVGFQFGNYTAEDQKGLPVGLFAEVSAMAGMGYNWQRFYTLLSYTLDANFVNMQESHRYTYNTGKLKLVIGFKI